MSESRVHPVTGVPMEYRTGKPAEWPPEKEAVVAAPGNHIVLFENDSVRVLQVVIQPGEREKPHHHPWPSVLYMSEGDQFVDRDGSGQTILDTRELDEPIALPVTMWKEPEALHSVENLSTSRAIRLLRVELKS